MIGNYQPYLILALDPPQSPRAGHDTGDVGPVDRMRQRVAATTSPGYMNEREERVRLPQGLNERRLDNKQNIGVSHRHNPRIRAKTEETWKEDVASSIGSRANSSI